MGQIEKIALSKANAAITSANNINNSVLSASPKGVYATLTDLQTAYPTGTTGVYVVTADGKWYYWNGSAWTAGGVYQGTSYQEGIDARTDSVGKVYETLKGRLNAKDIGILTAIQTGEYKIVFDDWEVGSLSNGANATNTSRIRNKNHQQFEIGESITLNPQSGYQISAFQYDQNKTYISQIVCLTKTDITIAYPFIRFLILKVGSSVPVDVSLANYVTITKKTNPYLSSEIINARTDSDGNSFNNLKENFDNVLSILKTGKNNLKYSDWEVGSLYSSDGTNAANTTRIRTAGMHSYAVGSILVFEPETGYQVAVYEYDANGVYQKNTVIASLTKFTFSHPKYRLLFLKINNSDNVDTTLSNHLNVYAEYDIIAKSQNIVVTQETVTTQIQQQVVSSQIEVVESARNAANHEMTIGGTSYQGLLPSNNPDVNAVIMQDLLDTGGDIIVDVPGTYNFDALLKIGSNTSLKFGNGVYCKKTSEASNGFLINKGAYTKTYDDNVKIKGLWLVCDEKKNGGGGIAGLNGHLSFFYIRNLKIKDIVCEDLPANTYFSQYCNFDNVEIDKIRVFGQKDAVHINRGNKITVRNGLFRTWDDPIALNAHDYPTGCPELGWINNVLVENCVDLSDLDTSGFFARMLGGSWLDWSQNMEVRYSDTVVSNGNVYRLMTGYGTTTLRTSVDQPTHESGDFIYPDGLRWRFIQSGVMYNAGCKNITFRDIYLQKDRGVAIALNFEDDGYCRSVYPNSSMPVQSNITLDNVACDAQFTRFLDIKTPVDVVKIINSKLTGYVNIIHMNNYFDDTNRKVKLNMLNNVYTQSGNTNIIVCATGRTCDAKIIGSAALHDDFVASATGSVTFKENDMSGT